MVNRKNLPLYIDALSFAQEKKSGIGHIAEELSQALAQELSLSKNNPQYKKLYLVVTLGKAKYVRKYENTVVGIKTILLPARILHLLIKLNLLPPLDIFLGKGSYIFPNYRNWPLLFSPSYTYIHDLTYKHYPDFTEPKNLAYLRKNIPIWVKRTTCVITSSNYTKEEIVHHLRVEPSKVKVIPHGVNKQEFFRVSSRESQSIIEKYGIKVRDYILYVGNFEPRKNITGLINAYRLLPDRLRNKHPLLLVGGGGWNNDSIYKSISLAKKDGLQILQPNMYVLDKDLPAFYSGAAVTTLVSFYEGFGLPPLQAASCGSLIVVAENSSMREIFKDSSIFVEADDTKTISKGLEDALTLTQEDRKLYLDKEKVLTQKYSWKEAASQLLKAIEGNDE